MQEKSLLLQFDLMQVEIQKINSRWKIRRICQTGQKNVNFYSGKTLIFVFSQETYCSAKQ